MMSYRKKMVVSGCGLLAVFIALLFIAIDHTWEFVCERKLPADEISSVVNHFKIIVLILGGGFLFLHSLSTWILFNRLSRPVQKICDHILSYTEGGLFPSIELDSIPKGEFAKIASIINAMIGKIKKQMDHLMFSRIETLEILESLSEGVVAVDNEGKATFANESACKTLGISREKLLSRPFHQIDALQKDLVSKSCEAIQAVLQTNETVRQMWTDEKQGKTHLELTAAPRPGKRGAILVLQDKSCDFKVLEMGKAFIANASHELKTPITIIRGFAETLKDHPELSPETMHDILEKIVRTSHRLEHLVKSLLTLADIENFSPDHLQSTDLMSIVENCKQLAKSAHLQSQIEVASDSDHALVLGDPQLLDLAVMNLLENAIKYSPSPAQVSLSIQKTDSEIHLIVMDKGIGIPAADLPHIFDRFYTVDKARSRKSGGAGLGLSIVKTIIEKHCGTVTVASEPGLGSSFTISLPKQLF